MAAVYADADVAHYKAFDSDLGFQFEIGTTHAIECDVEPDPKVVASEGFHCCKVALHLCRYYPILSRFCEVRVGGVVVGDQGLYKDKTVCETITIVREVVGEELDSLLEGELSKAQAKYGDRE